MTGYSRGHKALLQWQDASGGKTPQDHVQELERKWAFWSENIRPHTKADCSLDQQRARWVSDKARKRGNEQRPVFEQKVLRGTGSAEREQAAGCDS